MQLPTQLPTASQVNAGMRHVYTAGATAFTILAAFAIIPPDKVQPALDALHKMGAAVNDFMGAASSLWMIIGPGIMVWIGKIAVGSASFKSQLSAVTKAASAPADTEKKAELAQATANVPGIAQVTTAPEIARAANDAKVVEHQ